MSDTLKQITHLKDLTPDPQNARTHSPRNIGMIERALNEVGAARSIVVDEDGVILAGNGVVEAAAQAGIERVRVVEADGNELIAVRRRGLTPEQKTRLALFDNRATELSEWDADVLAELSQQVDLSQLFTADELAALLAPALPAPSGGGDDFDATPADGPTRCTTGDLWLIDGGKHRLVVGNCTEAAVVARLMDGEQPFLMVTDPPYGVEYDAGWRNEAAAAGHLAYAARRVGEVPNDHRDDWSEAYALFPGDVVYCWHAGVHASSTQRHLEALEFEIRSQIIWAKSNFPISRGHYHWRHEPCWYAVRKGATAHWCGDRTQTTLWEINLDRNVEGGHSTQKPLECMARPIRNHDAPIVYDPFLGSGTTLIAAHRLGRRCYGCEISERYADVILRRAEAEGLSCERATDH